MIMAWPAEFADYNHIAKLCILSRYVYPQIKQYEKQYILIYCIKHSWDIISLDTLEVLVEWKQNKCIRVFHEMPRM